MDERADGIESDWVVRRYIQICILILITVIVSPIRHPTTIALMCILFFLGYYFIALPEMNQIKQRKLQEKRRRLQEMEVVKRVQRALALKEEGIEQYLNGHYHDAIETLEKSVDLNGGDAASLKYLGLSYLALHRNERALNYLKRACDVNPYDAEVYEQIESIRSHLEFKYSVRKFYNKKDEVKSATGSARKMWRLPGEAKSEKMMRRINRNLKIEQERASRAAEARNYLQLGRIHVKLQRYDEALKYYKRSLYLERDLQNREGEAFLHLQIGDLYRSTQQYVKAMEHFVLGLAIERELGMREDETKILYQIGLTYQEMCQYAEALNYYNQSLMVAREIGFKELEIKILEQIAAIEAKTNSEWNCDEVSDDIPPPD